MTGEKVPRSLGCGDRGGVLSGGEPGVGGGRLVNELGRGAGPGDAIGGNQQVEEQMLSEAAQNGMRVASVIDGRCEGVIELTEILDELVAGKSGGGIEVGQAGAFEVVEDAEFGHELRLFGRGLAGGREGGFESLLFILEDGEHGGGTVRRDGGAVELEVGMLAELVEHFSSQGECGNGWRMGMRQEPGEVEQRLVLRDDGESAVEGKFPEPAGVHEGVGARRWSAG